MNIKNPLIFFAAFFMAFSLMAQTKPAFHFVEVSYDSLPVVAKKAGKPIMLYFHFDACAVCKRMEQSTFQNQKVIDVANQGFVIYSVNTQKGTGIAINSRWEIMIHPTFMFLNEEGELIFKAEGYKTSEQFLAMLDKAKTSEPSLSYYRKLYDMGDRPPELLRQIVVMKDELHMLADNDISEYINSQVRARMPLPFNMDFIYTYMVYNNHVVMDFNSSPYYFLLHNKELFYSRYGKSETDKLILYVAKVAELRATENGDTDLQARAEGVIKQFQ